MRIYIAGPMSGIAHHNFPAFDEAAKLVRGRGHDAVSPAELDRARGYVPPADGKIDRATYIRFLREDIKILMDCDAVFMLRGWSCSNGACIEHDTAQVLDYLTFYHIDEVPILL